MVFALVKETAIFLVLPCSCKDGKGVVLERKTDA